MYHGHLDELTTNRRILLVRKIVDELQQIFAGSNEELQCRIEQLEDEVYASASNVEQYFTTMGSRSTTLRAELLQSTAVTVTGEWEPRHAPGAELSMMSLTAVEEQGDARNEIPQQDFTQLQIQTQADQENQDEVELQEERSSFDSGQGSCSTPSGMTAAGCGSSRQCCCDGHMSPNGAQRCEGHDDEGQHQREPSTYDKHLQPPLQLQEHAVLPQCLFFGSVVQFQQTQVLLGFEGGLPQQTPLCQDRPQPEPTCQLLGPSRAPREVSGSAGLDSTRLETTEDAAGGGRAGASVQDGGVHGGS
ncbi:hypothetical protein Agub_g7682, partial [Astrephomene gubernaculifera]